MAFPAKKAALKRYVGELRRVCQNMQARIDKMKRAEIKEDMLNNWSDGTMSEQEAILMADAEMIVWMEGQPTIGPVHEPTGVIGSRRSYLLEGLDCD